MSYGIDVRNIEGNVLIDATHRNYYITQRGTFGNGIPPIKLEREEIFLVNAPFGHKISVSHSPGLFYFSFNITNAIIRCTAGSYNYAVATPSDYPIASLKTDYGLKIYNPDGAICYDSGAVVMTAVSNTEIPSPSINVFGGTAISPINIDLPDIGYGPVYVPLSSMGVWGVRTNVRDYNQYDQGITSVEFTNDTMIRAIREWGPSTYAKWGSGNFVSRRWLLAVRING